MEPSVAIRVRTPHNPNDTSVLRVGGWVAGWVAGWPGGRVAGWVGGWVVYQSNNATLWLHLASWNLPDSQLS